MKKSQACEQEFMAFKNELHSFIFRLFNNRQDAKDLANSSRK